MGLSFLTPLFLAGFLAVAVPVLVHLIRRHRGRNLAFPSLMFLRRLPVQSVRRRKIRDWPLLLLRAGALALIILAFARPVLQPGGLQEGAAGDGLREVVVVLDRSWSMNRGDRWERAIVEARSVLDELVTPDRVSLVTFDQVGRIIVDPTLDPSRMQAALDTLLPGWGGTQLGAGLQAAGGIVQTSERSRREVVLISDFQRQGWEDGPHDPLPQGTRLTAVDVGDDGLGSMVVSEVSLEHSFLEGRQRVQPVVRVVRQGESAPTTARLAFEMDGQEVAARTVELPSEGAASVPFDPITLPEEGIRGSLRLEPEGADAEEPFRFFLSPHEIRTVLLVQEGGESQTAAPYLRNALALGGSAPVRVEIRGIAQISEADLAATDLVILNDAPLPSGQSGALLRGHVRDGGGLLIAAGPGSGPAGWDDEWEALLPGQVGAPVDRNPARGARLSAIDRDHPVFQTFNGAEAAGLGTPRFYRYRAFEMVAGEDSEGEGLVQAPRVLARFDDGSPALVENALGTGRVLVWTSTLDTAWGDFPLHPVFLPVVQEIARYATGGRESVPYFTVGHPLDSRFILGATASSDEPATEPAEASGDGSGGAPTPSDAVLVGPDGTGIELASRWSQLLRLERPGFYDLRAGDEAGEVMRTIAVNPDAREADPARMDPEELVLAATSGNNSIRGEGEETAEGLLLDGPNPAALLQEGERRQGAWRFFLLGAIVLLIGEAVLAGRRGPLATQVRDT